MTEAAPSQLTRLLGAHTENSDSTNSQHQFLQLALQIKHNLEFQHRWTKIQLHTKSPLTGEHLERPLLSGLPPRRIYVNPDEQVDLLRRETERKKQVKALAKASPNESILDEDIVLEPELEWVFPAHLREEWTLRRFGTLFDSIGPLPPPGNVSSTIDEPGTKWRTVKRALLATLQDDSTIVYYFVHDGIVKPRQN
jgi:tRNA-splicing endonuclease subunit Sen15